MHGSPSREVNSMGENNGVLFGLCCPTRRTNRSAFVCLLPKNHFCSAICWVRPCSDDQSTGVTATARRADRGAAASPEEGHPTTARGGPGGISTGGPDPAATAAPRGADRAVVWAQRDGSRLGIVRTMVILNRKKSRSGPCYGTAPEQGNSCYKRCSGVQPFSQQSRTPTVAKEFQIGLYDPAEADLELFCNSWSAGFLGERLYGPDLEVES